MNLDDYLAILRRRRWVILVPIVVGPLIAFLISLAIPDRYTSQTLVLVEHQKVPESYVKSVVTDELNTRLSTMQEQILSRTRLQPVIERYGLYKRDVGKVPMEDLVARLRKAIKVTPVTTIARSAEGLPGFFISVEANDARTTQQICAEITSMFMTENLQAREQHAEGTTEFLRKQLGEAKGKLDEQDKKLAAFKSRYIGQLPGQEQTNLNLLMGMNTQLEAVTQLLTRAQQDKVYMESLFSQQLAAWEASQTGNNPETLEQRLGKLQSELVTLEARYTSSHPDVIKMKNDIAQLKKKIEQANAEAKEKPADRNQNARLGEPAEIVQLRNQIHVAEETIREKSREQEQLQKQIKVYQARVQLSPVVEEEYKQLTRDYETALAFYRDLLAKESNSEMATDLERRQQGEQFRVMDPANLPEAPTFPKRWLFALGGLGGGLGLGLGIAFLLEMRDKSLRTDRDVEFFLGLPTLAMVPWVGTNGKKSSRGFPRRAGRESAAARLEV